MSINLNKAAGPPTYRLSNPDDISHGGGTADVDSVLPITNVRDISGTETIGIDITKLDSLQ